MTAKQIDLLKRAVTLVNTANSGLKKSPLIKAALNEASELIVDSLEEGHADG